MVAHKAQRDILNMYRRLCLQVSLKITCEAHRAGSLHFGGGWVLYDADLVVSVRLMTCLEAAVRRTTPGRVPELVARQLGQQRKLPDHLQQGDW